MSSKPTQGQGRGGSKNFKAVTPKVSNNNKVATSSNKNYASIVGLVQEVHTPKMNVSGQPVQRQTKSFFSIP